MLALKVSMRKTKCVGLDDYIEMRMIPIKEILKEFIYNFLDNIALCQLQIQMNVIKELLSQDF